MIWNPWDCTGCRRYLPMRQGRLYELLIRTPGLEAAARCTRADPHAVLATRTSIAPAASGQSMHGTGTRYGHLADYQGGLRIAARSMARAGRRLRSTGSGAGRRVPATRRYRTHAAGPQPVPVRDDCTRPVRARGYCVMHYAPGDLRPGLRGRQVRDAEPPTASVTGDGRRVTGCHVMSGRAVCWYSFEAVPGAGLGRAPGGRLRIVHHDERALGPTTSPGEPRASGYVLQPSASGCLDRIGVHRRVSRGRHG